MNRADARATWTPRGYVGEFRLVWKSDYQPVLKTDAKGRKLGPEYFPTKDAAEVAAWRMKNDIEQPVMIRGGDKCQAQRATAEALFKNGRKIPVETKGSASQNPNGKGL